jgi:hypothetical protein
MRGRQINFFLGPSDQAPFEDALRRVDELAILQSRSRTPVPEPIASTVIRQYGIEPLRILLARPSDVSKISAHQILGSDEYTCDPVADLIVEFDRSYVSTGLIRPGRLFYYASLIGSEGPVDKATAFVEWASGLFRGARGFLVRIDRYWWAGPEALRLSSLGHKLEGLG